MGTGLTCVFMSALWWSRGATSFPRRTGYGDERRFPVVLVAMDFTPSDRDRVKPFAFFGDAVATCLLGRGRVGLRLLSSAIRLDPAGLAGEDSFASRQQVAQAAYGAAFEHGGDAPAEVAKVFPTNLFQPLTGFGSSVVGVPRAHSPPSRPYGLR